MFIGPVQHGSVQHPVLYVLVLCLCIQTRTFTFHTKVILYFIPVQYCIGQLQQQQQQFNNPLLLLIFFCKSISDRLKTFAQFLVGSFLHLTFTHNHVPKRTVELIQTGFSSCFFHPSSGTISIHCTFAKLSFAG